MDWVDFVVLAGLAIFEICLLRHLRWRNGERERVATVVENRVIRSLKAALFTPESAEAQRNAEPSSRAVSI